MNRHMSGDRPQVVHAYGVMAAGTDVLLPTAGIADAPVRLVEAEDLAAVVSPLDAYRFGERAWQDHAEDPEWLAPLAA